jgi:hypothetical protein
LRGNDKYEGFCIDLLEDIAKLNEFEYEIYVVPDGMYGARIDDETWSGMLGELLDAVSNDCIE